jgi:hypothetical protein
MSTETVQIVLHFNQEDRGWMRINKVDVPNFWRGHAVSPALGDVVRLGGRQFTINARVWDHDGATTLLRIYLGVGHAQSDTIFDQGIH